MTVEFEWPEQFPKAYRINAVVIGGCAGNTEAWGIAYFHHTNQRPVRW